MGSVIMFLCVFRDINSSGIIFGGNKCCFWLIRLNESGLIDVVYGSCKFTDAEVLNRVSILRRVQSC